MKPIEPIIRETKPLSPLQAFFAKVAAVTIAALIFVYFSVSLISTFIDAKTEQWQLVMKGGPGFWGMVEQKLYGLADGPEIPPERREKIVAALRRLSTKYKPYFDAIGHDVPEDQPTHLSDNTDNAAALQRRP
jgi:hypothetical protein